MSTNVCAKFCRAAPRVKKALGIFRELIPTTTTTGVAFWDPPSGSKNSQIWITILQKLTKSVHNFLSNLADRQTDRPKNITTFI